MEANAILDGTVVLGGHGHGTRQEAVPGGAVGGPPVLRMEPLLRPSSTSSSSASTTGARASTSALQLPPPPSLLRVSHGIDQRRHKGEDRTAQLQSGAISLYLVADGHGGSGAARLAAERLLRDIGTAMAAGAAGAAEAVGGEGCGLRQAMLVQTMRAAFARLHAAAQQAERSSTHLHMHMRMHMRVHMLYARITACALLWTRCMCMHMPCRGSTPPRDARAQWWPSTVRRGG